MNAYAEIPLEILKNIGAGIPLLSHLKEKYSLRRSELLADYERPFAIFEQMLERCGENLNLEGKVVLEVGPGNSLAMGLLFLAHGARKVFLIDRFKHFFWDRQDILYHEKVMERIKTKGLPFGDSAIRAVFFKNGTVHCEKEKLEYRFGDAATLPLGTGSVDLVFSNAVLEHIHDVERAVGEFSRVTKSGGAGINEVDLRDHFFQKSPLRLLQYPDWLWRAMTWNRPGYTNRLRFSDYLNLFRAGGFEIQKNLIVKRYEGNVKELKINRKFCSYSPDELGILAFWVMLRKTV